MRNIIYIINPISGSRSKKGLQSLIEKETAARGFGFQVFPSVASGDYSFLLPVIRDNKITDVVIAGGDGTFSQVAGSLLDAPVNFGIIPCGSGNGLAFTAKIPRSKSKALQLVFDGKASPVDGFYVNGKFACMLCGLGFDAKVAHDFSEQSTRGLATYVRQVLKNFFRAKTYPFGLRVNERSFKTDAFFISIANSNQFGNNFTIAPKASLSDGLLDFVICTEQSKMSIVFQTVLQVMGRNKLTPEDHFNDPASIIEKKKGVIYFQADKIHIRNTGKAPLHIDGDPAETPGELDIKIRRNAFRLIQP